MKSLRWILPSLALSALLGSGCIIASAQIFSHFGLTNPFIIDSSSSAFQREFVDLNTVSDYSDNKDKLKGLSDLAVVGKLTNIAGPAGSVEIWITAGNTNLLTIPGITASATKLWGPATIGATGSVTNIDWDESAKLFSASGKKLLIDEALGGGTFTIYIIGTGGTYKIKVDNAEIILVLDAGA